MGAPQNVEGAMRDGGLSEEQARAREIDLREREVFLQEQRARLETRSSLLDWARGLALPIASIIVSAAIFLVQTQQMAVQDAWENAREGYKQYFEGIRAAPIDSEAGYEDALAVFVATTQAFPEIFCGARQDFAVRLDRSVLPRATVDSRLAELRARTAPVRDSFYPADLLRFLRSTPAACGAIVLENEQAMAGAARAAMTRSFRVWVHVGARRVDLSPIDRLRESAGAQGFRVISQVATSEQGVAAAEVRYFSENESAAAERLAALLTEEFASEGLGFTARLASERYMNLPNNSLEAFIPDPPPPALRH
jgi:hypothetical protein